MTHAIEDILFGAAVIAFALDDRVPNEVARAAVRLLMDAHHEGRAQELVDAARREAATVLDWHCEPCGEINPGTFDVCWSCCAPRPEGAAQPDAEASTILAINHLAMSRLPKPSDELIRPEIAAPRDEGVSAPRLETKCSVPPVS